MKPRICFCPSSLAWIIKHLKKSAVPKFRRMIKGTPKEILRYDPVLEIMKEVGRKRKKRRTAKQIRATKKLIAFNKRRRARR